MYQGPQSGKFGIIHNEELPITHMFNWTFDTISHTPETYYASNTLWGPDRNPGVIDWTGNFSLFDGRYIIFPGQFLKCLEFFTAPSTGVYGNVGQTYCGQGIVDSTVLTWAWGAEQSLTQVVNFSANGCLANRNRVIDDTTIRTPDKMCGLQLQYALGDGVPSWVLFENIQQAVLTMESNNPTYVNSSTGCCTHRRPGNINWTLALTLTDHRTVTYSRTDLLSFRLYNSATTFWELVFGIFSGTSGVIANRQTGEIQQQVANFSMKALSDNGVGHIGWGTDPLSAPYIWPPVATTNTVPGPPTGVSGSESTPYNVSVGWTAPSTGDAPTGYTVWASLDGVDFAVVGCSASDSYLDIGLPTLRQGESDYDVYYKINAFNAQGQGPFSAVSAAVNVDGV